MTYALGVDLGTTYSAAAIHADDRVELASLGDHEAAIPTVVHWARDGALLIGEAAERRAATSTGCTAREFKRRIGDATPLILDGVPRSPQALMAAVLRRVVDRVGELRGGPPDTMALSYPANWGGYRLELLTQALAQEGLTGLRFVTEPEAAAVAYASTERVTPGDVIGVYDLGGGTFDAAVLRREDDGFTVLGQPVGIEHLGGVDVDEAVFAHVRRTLDLDLAALDPDDLASAAALHQLRRDCVQAKELLSYDCEALIPVNLPEVRSMVRITRAELDELTRPLLAETVRAFRRALKSAGCAKGALSAVVLAGGSSRMPQVGQLLSADLGLAVSVDVHPKHVVALGAARLAGPARTPPATDGRSGGPRPRTGGTTAVPGPFPVVPPPRPEPVHAVGASPELFPVVPPPRPEPVRAVGAPPDTPRTTRRAAGRRHAVLVLASLGCVVAVLMIAGFGLGGSGSAPAPPSPRLFQGASPVVDGRVRLSDPLTMRGSGAGTTVEVWLAGLRLAAEQVDAAGTFSLKGIRFLAPGPVEVSVGGADQALVLRPEDTGLVTLPSAVGLVLLMFAAAYAEYLLRPLRLTGRASAGTRLGMGLIGAVGGTGTAVLGWAVTRNHLLTVPVLLLTAVLGLAAALGLTVLLSARRAPSGVLFRGR